MNILVTGGAGFIGANLVRRLTEAHEEGEVIVLDDLSTGTRENLIDTNATLVEGSILDEELLEDLVADVSAIVHLAGRGSVPRSVKYPFAAHEVNATGTVKVLESARRRGGIQVIVASSSSVYGRTKTLPVHEDLPSRPISPYAASKLATEAYSLAWSHAYDLPILVFRFFNVFGPLQAPDHTYAAAIPAFLRAAFQNQPIPIHGDGTQSRDFTYVESVVDVIADALARRIGHLAPINLAFGSRITLLEIVAELELIFERDLPIEFLDPREGDVPHTQADPTCLKSLFPHIKPAKTSDGLRDTVRWFKGARPW